MSKSPKIILHNSQRDFPLSMTKVRKAISFLLKELKISTDEIIFHFVSEFKISLLHKKFFNDPSSTDCITFPIDPHIGHLSSEGSYHVLGEAFICPKAALEYSKSHGIEPLEELYRYISHCILHLIGYDDIQAADRMLMKRKEQSCLRKLYKARHLSF